MRLGDALETFNRLTKIFSIIIILTLIAAIGAALWAVYKYIPDLRGKIREGTAQAVAQWFPVSPDGEFSYDLDISLHPRRCRLINLDITNGSGKVLQNLTLNKYNLKAASVELDLDALLKGQQSYITGIEGVALNGEILLADLGAYYIPDKSGITNIGFEYDEFTEKVILRFEITELALGRITVTGKVTPTEDREGITLAERKYFNIEGQMPADIIQFIEEHSNLDIEFSISDFPLKVKKFTLTTKSLNVELERE